MNQFKSILFLITITLLYGCDSSSKKQNKPSPRVKNISKVVEPRNGVRKTIGDTVVFKITSNDAEITIDSISISSNSRSIAYNQSIWNTSNETPGRKMLTLSVHLSNGTVERKRHVVTLLSDVKPVRYTYRVTNTFVHDPDAFTEGLFVKDGQLYESTGNHGESSLRRVNLKTGEVLQSADLSTQYFGEGISMVNNKIYMLTYKARTGLVFDKNSFEQIGQFSYATEGWGMTVKEDTLIMSDGTNVLRFMEPVSFSEVRRLEVYDQNGAIDMLNELEYIKGDLFAVRWQTETIYIIDPNNGKVKGILDLAGIFDYSKYNRRFDVLNGIAYDKNLDKYYITGKWWPKLFEIQLIAANNI